MGSQGGAQIQAPKTNQTVWCMWLQVTFWVTVHMHTRTHGHTHTHTHIHTHTHTHNTHATHTHTRNTHTHIQHTHTHIRMYIRSKNGMCMCQWIIHYICTNWFNTCLYTHTHTYVRTYETRTFVPHSKNLHRCHKYQVCP